MGPTDKSQVLTDNSRRNFIACCSGFGLGASLLPGLVYAQVQQEGASSISAPMLKNAIIMAGLEIGDEEQAKMLGAMNESLKGYAALHAIHIPNDVQPPFYFSAITPGMEVNRTRQPLQFSAPKVKRPANLEDAAFWSVSQLAQLLRTKQVTSVELTKMYLGRLHRYNQKLECVVTFLDDVAMEQAKKADADIATGKFRSAVHGIPWGAKDIIAAKGYKTTWGSGAYRDQMIDEDASVIEMLREGGAVLIAKLTSGELAGGDRWFGGQTKNPWNIKEGSGGSSAGPGSSTGAGCVGFAIGTETAGSILGPSSRCGVTGLRPTFGRISRQGVMALSWTQDRVGPMCRYAEDCALVMSVIAKPDGKDLSVSEIPFNYNAHLDVKKVRVGYLQEAFDEITDGEAKRVNDKMVADLQALGIKLVPVNVPEFPMDTAAHNVEMATFFDELVRNGNWRNLTVQSRGDGFRINRLVPAVEYLQSQRLRAMMMAKLAEATSGVDVYIAPTGRQGGGGRGAGAPGDGPGRGGPGLNEGFGRPLSKQAAQRHSNMANLAGYPGIAVPNGFSEGGTPTSATFFARPFAEAELLAVAKAYQDSTGHHLKHPNLDAQSPSAL